MLRAIERLSHKAKSKAPLSIYGSVAQIIDDIYDWSTYLYSTVQCLRRVSLLYVAPLSLPHV